MGFSLQNFVQFFVEEKKYAILLLISGAIFGLAMLTFPQTERVASPAQQKFDKIERVQEKEGGLEKLLSVLDKNPQIKRALYLFNIFLFLVFHLGIGLVIWSAIRYYKKKTIVEEVPFPDAKFGMRDVVRFLIVAFSFTLLLGVFFRFLSVYFQFDLSSGSYTLLHATIVDLFILLLIYFFGIKQYGRTWQDIGLHFDHFFSHLKVSFLTYCWVVPIFVSLVFLLSLIVKLIQYEPPPHQLIDILVVEDNRNAFVVGYSVVLACLIGPVIEEIFFRGFLYTALRKRFGVSIAMAVTAIFFAYIHFSVFAFLPIFFLGLVLAYLREKKGSLMPSIYMHMMHNTILISYFFIIKRGLIDPISGGV